VFVVFVVATACFDGNQKSSEICRFSQLIIELTLDLIYGNNLYKFVHGQAVVQASLCPAIV
jgi:hypothetical protein